MDGVVGTFRCSVLTGVLLLLASSLSIAQGPSSRPVLPGPTIQVRSGRYGEERSEATEIPVPDLFRMEAPFVERNFRFDYLATNNLHEPAADESQFFAELSYSFTDRFGLIVASPLLIRDNEIDPNTTGFGDLETGARYVLLGYENEDPLKLALGLNVLAPTGSAERELGEGQTFIEPEVLLFQRLMDEAFVQGQFSLGVPTGGEETSTEWGWNIGAGYVFADASVSQYFKFPTAVFEVNGATGLGGSDGGVTVVDLTPGLRWTLGSKAFGGIAMSVPVTGPREFEAQFIFSVIYRYGASDEVGRDPTSSRAYF